MMRSLFSGVSGLKNHQTRMDVIGNNIANVNTTGYKSSRVTFTDTLQQTLSGASAPTDNVGGTNPKQIGLGSAVGSIDMIMTDGSVQSTGKNTDLCLSGSGFFVVRGAAGEFYTRDGAFEFDGKGNYVLPGSGLYVQGWTADANGEINTNGGVGNIVVEAGKSMGSNVTKVASYSKNLDAGVEGTKVTGINVSYVDGTTEMVEQYTPTKVEKGIVLNCGNRSIMLDSTAETFVLDGTKTANENYDANKDKKCWTSTVEGLAGRLALTLDGSSYTGGITYNPTLGDPPTLNWNTGSKYYTNGDEFKDLEQQITHIDADPVAGTLKLTFADSEAIKEVIIPVPENVTYSAGDMFKFDLLKLSAVKGDGTGPVEAKFTNGDVLSSAKKDELKTAAIDQEVVANLKDFGVTTLNSTTESNGDAYFFNGKQVDSVRVIQESGGMMQALIGKDYKKDDMFYPSCATTITAYDSLGNSHEIPVLFTKTGANTWQLSFAGGTDSYTIKEATGSTMTCKMTQEDLVFTDEGVYSSGSASIALSYDDLNGAADGIVSVELSRLTQYSGSSTIACSADGNAAGTLKSISIDSAGVITGTYTNGLNRKEAQVALEQFNNPAGLTKTGSSLYQVSNNSGTPSKYYTATDIGTTITPSALEMSNVDIANEFSDMIVTQRGFQSNSKIITVSDEMIETLVNMKR